MHTIIPPLKSASRPRRPAVSDVRKPHYDCSEQDGALRLSVFMPEVDAVGVELTVRGPDLIIRGRKRHIVRANWRALHLEGAQHDYELRLRLGRSLDYDGLRAELEDGLLTLDIPRLAKAGETIRSVA